MVAVSPLPELSGFNPRRDVSASQTTNLDSQAERLVAVSIPGGMYRPLRHGHYPA